MCKSLSGPFKARLILSVVEDMYFPSVATAANPGEVSD